MMGKRGRKPRIFKVGDYVFAKVRGYRPWPAKITKVTNNKYVVSFYGTEERSPHLSPRDLLDYFNFKSKFCTKTNDPNYNRGLELIEQEATGKNIKQINNIRLKSKRVIKPKNSKDQTEQKPIKKKKRQNCHNIPTESKSSRGASNTIQKKKSKQINQEIMTRRKMNQNINSRQNISNNNQNIVPIVKEAVNINDVSHYSYVSFMYNDMENENNSINVNDNMVINNSLASQCIFEENQYFITKDDTSVIETVISFNLY